jgi:uncharacterized UBP type Zn finger protein
VTEICTHLHTIEHLEPRPESAVCPDCVAIGGRWRHLRRWTSCGRIGCCDDSPNRHATAHHKVTSHPIIRSLESGEEWLWCYEDEVAFVLSED